MTETQTPTWATCTITFGDTEPGRELAASMEQAGRALGGIRIMDLGNGTVALDETAVADLERQPADADGCIDDGQCWIGGLAWDVRDLRHALALDTLGYIERSTR